MRAPLRPQHRTIYDIWIVCLVACQKLMWQEHRWINKIIFIISVKIYKVSLVPRGYWALLCSLLNITTSRTINVSNRPPSRYLSPGRAFSNRANSTQVWRKGPLLLLLPCCLHIVLRRRVSFVLATAFPKNPLGKGILQVWSKPQVTTQEGQDRHPLLLIQC